MISIARFCIILLYAAMNCRFNKYFFLFLRKFVGIKRYIDVIRIVNRGRYVLKCRSRRKLIFYICCGK